jgi:steroid 5-alpha reductase family enzyme
MGILSKSGLEVRQLSSNYSHGKLRYEIFRKKIDAMGIGWWWSSFWIVYISQFLMIWLSTLPLWTLVSKNTPINMWDIAAAVVTFIAIIIEGFADDQLQTYMEKRSKNPNSTSLILDTGLWKYSRHPNYFGTKFVRKKNVS